MVKKNAIMRYKILDGLLSDRNRYYSVNDLLEKVNAALTLDGMDYVSRRCIEMDLRALECAPYNAPIKRRIWKNHKMCIRYAEEGFSIFVKKLSDDEETMLTRLCAVAAGAISSTSSTKEFHAPQDGHFPIHLGVLYSHSEQR